jgi:hypothetical protein
MSSSKRDMEDLMGGVSLSGAMVIDSLQDD